MKTVDKLLMLHMAVSDMDKSKAFYVDKLGFKATRDVDQKVYRLVHMELPGGGVSINLTNLNENMKPGTMKLYFGTSDIKDAYKVLTEKGVKPKNEIKDDSWGMWFDFDDPDGNHLFIVQSLRV
jgi:predicted enzyme related to lactoylglutathione lyase